MVTLAGAEHDSILAKKDATSGEFRTGRFVFVLLIDEPGPCLGNYVATAYSHKKHWRLQSAGLCHFFLF